MLDQSSYEERCAGLEWHPDPKIIAALTSKQILDQPNLGKVSLGEIISWLLGQELTLADDPTEENKPRCPHCGQVIRKKYKTNGK